GRAVRRLDLAGSPSLPPHPAEQGTDLLRVEGHAPASITAAYAGLDDALVVAETAHRAPPSRSPEQRSKKARSDTHRDRLMCTCRSTGDDSAPTCPVTHRSSTSPA